MLGELAVKDELTTDPEYPDPPAKKLKQMIDRDIRFEVSLKDCCKKTGYSVSHIRKMFVRHFGIDPGEYRQRKKLERVFSLMSAGNMSLKEVAGEIGMKNVTHLNLFIRKRCNMTPGELYRNFRNKKSFPELIL